MSADELTHVIYTSGLDSAAVDEEAPVLDICPRTVLGLSCVEAHFECLCATVEAYEWSLGRVNETPVSLNLDMKVPPRGLCAAQAIIDGIEMTGLVASIEASSKEVRASFAFNKVQNYELAEFVKGTLV